MFGRFVSVSVLGLGVTLGVAAPASAAIENFHGQNVDIQYWSGTGSNQAVLVVDFGSNQSYAFGYRFDDAGTISRPTGYTYTTSHPTAAANHSEAMLLSLDGNGVGGTLDVQYSYHDYLGFSLDGLSYQGKSIVSDPGWNPRFLAFYIKGNVAYDQPIYDLDWNITGYNHIPATSGTSAWQYAWDFGATDRVLADGFYDGWTQGLNWDSSAPVTPVPEPASLLVLSLGGVALLAQRRGTRA